jgi:flagellar biosynthesis protein FlhF
MAAPEAMQWMMEAIRRNIHTGHHALPLYQEGGIYALVGATGVGKTTTAAKLAGLCAEIHGPSSVGLITLDTQRVGAHAQLREHARSLGLVAHLAHDRAALQDLLGLFAAKKMVLIDTTGLAPRDPRKNDALDVLDLPDVRRLLVLNAGAHGDTLDEVVAAFKSVEQQPTVLSKIDEAVKLGPALDVVMRHQLVLRGVTNGQKVPHDWDTANAAELVRDSMRVNSKSAFDPKSTDLGFLFAAPDKHGAATGRARA